MNPQLVPGVPNQRGLTGPECLFLSKCALEGDWTVVSRRFGVAEAEMGWETNGLCQSMLNWCLKKDEQARTPALALKGCSDAPRFGLRFEGKAVGYQFPWIRKGLAGVAHGL